MNSRILVARGVSKLRRERGLTQAELAEAAGMSLTFLAAIEQQSKQPSLDMLDDLSVALGVTPLAIFAAGAETAKGGLKKSALERALASMPALREEDLLDLLRVVSRIVVQSAPSKARRGSKATVTGARRGRAPGSRA